MIIWKRKNDRYGRRINDIFRKPACHLQTLLRAPRADAAVKRVLQPTLPLTAAAAGIPAAR